MTANSVRQLVADFWAQVGYEEAFPRMLERPIMSTAPVFIVKAPRTQLDTRYVQKWLNDHDIALPAPWQQRKLRGCLVAYRGRAAIFVDGTLPSDETRAVIGHEFGHYLAEYERPRSRIVRRLGTSLLDVLDGERRPSHEEQFAATLAGVELGVHVHFMDRGVESRNAAIISQVECTGDIVGAELLAPERAVAAAISRVSAAGHQPLLNLLQTHFGLPASYAYWYAARLSKRMKPKRTFSQVLGL